MFVQPVVEDCATCLRSRRCGHDVGTRWGYFHLDYSDDHEVAVVVAEVLRRHELRRLLLSFMRDDLSTSP